MRLTRRGTLVERGAMVCVFRGWTATSEWPRGARASQPVASVGRARMEKRRSAHGDTRCVRPDTGLGDAPQVAGSVGRSRRKRSWRSRAWQTSPTGLVDIDILVGEVSHLGQGVGSRALELLVERFRDARSFAFAGLGTSVSNTRAIRCYGEAGFQVLRAFRDPEWVHGST